MKMTPVTSSFIMAVGHDPSTSTMHVQFSNGTIEAHQDVSLDDHADFVDAPSLGKHYHAHFKGQGVTVERA